MRNYLSHLSRAAVLILIVPWGIEAASVNRPAPAFVLKNSAQKNRPLANFKGKIVFINFWASWCAPCQQELPELHQLAARYAGRNVRVLAINVDTDRKAAKKRLAALGLGRPGFEVLWDANSKVVSAYNIETMPTSFIVDTQGVIRYVHAGFHAADPERWRHEIDGLLTPSR